MRKLFLLLASATVAGGLAAPAPAATRDVNITKTGFSPVSPTVTAGDTVRWVNTDTASHQVVSDNGSFVSPTLTKGKTYAFKFTAAGTYRYRDALKPAERGTIIVRGAPPAVTLAVSAPIIVFGTEIRLTGAVNSAKAGETVTILVQPFGQASFIQVATVTTTTNGAWDFLTTPSIQTNYQVRYKNVASQPATVQVKPKLTLVPQGRGYFYAKVTASKSFATGWIYLQRKTGFGEWVSTARYRLGAQSGRIFKIPRRNGATTYRVFLPALQAGGGYLESWSGTQTVRMKLNARRR
jgi:plastocyanin